jgi:predicted metal-binding protein
MSSPIASPPITEVIVCTTCRPPGASRDEPAAGALLFDAVQAAQLLDDAPSPRVRVLGMACLSSCSRACSVAFQAPGKHTYLFGDLVPDDETAQHVLICAGLHAAADDGNLPRNQRPARLRSGILARLPAHLAEVAPS